jgi:hypothetical protein
MNIALREHDKMARIVAKELEQDGYAVLIEPTPDQLPFSLEGYNPDLVATKTDDNLIVEINRRQQPPRAVLDRYRRVADIVRAHRGWKFLIKTVSAQDREAQAPESSPSDIATIQQYLHKTRNIVSLGSAELATPYLWNAIVALLRHKDDGAAAPRSGLSDRSLINRLYTLGELSSEEYETLRRWEELRNRAVHDLGFIADTEEVVEMLSFAERLLSDLKS